MAFPVAVQSAVFYFLACTPCMAARTRYRTRQKSRKEREERARQQLDEPDLYRHPSPFNVNPYWEEEIMMGPSLPKKGKPSTNSKSTSQRKLTSAGKDSSIATRSSLAISSHETPNTASAKLGNIRADDTHVAAHSNRMNGGKGLHGVDEGRGDAPATACTVPASPTLIPDDVHSLNMVEQSATATTAASEGWNHRRYQREDEELWGSELSRTHKLMDAIVKAGSSAGRLLESTLGKDRPITTEDRANFYAPTVIHPPVNEYHPPVVSNKPAHRDAMRWMLQPPPPAKVMEGKVPVSRSTSIASTSSVGGNGAIRRPPAAISEVSLTRRMAMEARLRRVDSGNSALAASTSRVMTPTSCEDLVSSSPKRSMSRKLATVGAALSGPRSKSQRSNLPGRNRSGSGSLSSVEALDWSSGDESADGMNSRWRFPSTTPATLTSGSTTMTAPVAMATAEARMAQAQAQAEAKAKSQGPQHAQHTQHGHALTHLHMQPKLETILSSDASSKADLGPSEEMTQVAAPIRERIVVSGKAGQDSKTQHPRPAGSSIDSGLALAA